MCEHEVVAVAPLPWPREACGCLPWLCENTNAPVVVLSGDASKEAALAAVQKGARAYVVKPFTRDSMLRTIAGVFHASSPSLGTAKPPAK
jgi:CheY-like chemotaxis protein